MQSGCCTQSRGHRHTGTGCGTAKGLQWCPQSPGTQDCQQPPGAGPSQSRTPPPRAFEGAPLTTSLSRVPGQAPSWGRLPTGAVDGEPRGLLGMHPRPCCRPHPPTGHGNKSTWEKPLVTERDVFPDARNADVIWGSDLPWACPRGSRCSWRPHTGTRSSRCPDNRGCS